MAKKTKKPPWGSLRGDPPGSHAECTGEGTAQHAGRDDAQRVSCSEGNGAFRDEGSAEKPGCLAVLAFVEGEEFLVQDCGESHCQRRNHARSHHGAHDQPGRLVVGAAGGKSGHSEGVGNFVDGTAKVEAHHEAKDDTENHGGGSAHAREPAVQSCGKARNGAAEDQEHQPEATMEASSDDDNGHQATEPARYLPRPDQVSDVTRQKTANDAAEESCVHKAGYGARNESGRNTRPVGDCVGDVTGQCRDKEAHGQVTDLEGNGTQVDRQTTFGQVAEVVLQHHLVRNLSDVITAQKEAKGDQQPAAGHERNHVAHAGEECALQLLADVLALLLLIALSLLFSTGMGGNAACPGGSSAAARASRTILSGSSMPRLTGALMTGLPAKRSLPRTSTSTAKITASAAAITAGSSGLAPEDPWVST